MSFDRLTACLTRIDAESGMQFQTALGSGYDKRFAWRFKRHSLMRQIKKSEQSELCSDWRRWRDLNPRAGFLRRPPGFQDRSLQPLGYISKCISAPTFLGKKERNLERNPDFLLISYSRGPLKTQGKLKNGFQNTLPFSRPVPLCPLRQLPMVRRTAVCSKKLPQIPRAVNRKTPLYNDFRQKGVA